MCGAPIDTAPLFVDAKNGDFHLQAGSQCIDTGTNDALELPGTDKDGKPRIIDGDSNGQAVVDMGSYEFGDICECDLTHDGRCDM